MCVTNGTMNNNNDNYDDHINDEQQQHQLVQQIMKDADLQQQGKWKQHYNNMDYNFDNNNKNIKTHKMFSSFWNRNRKQKPRKRNVVSLVWILIELILFILLFTLYHSFDTFITFIDIYINPLIQLSYWDYDSDIFIRHLTYYNRICDSNDQTATNSNDILVNYNNVENNTMKELFQSNMNYHGVQLLPNLLSASTATKLRSYILQRNILNQDMIEVIAQQNRYSFYIKMDDDPIIQTVLYELLNNTLLLNSLELLMGQSALTIPIIELVALTSMNGALEQYYHPDVTDGSVHNTRSFIPVYSLFIPLQNTTSLMGATSIIPGSHVCSEYNQLINNESSGFQINGGNDYINDTIWPVGYGALMNSQTIHKGCAHNDPTPNHERVFVIPSFGIRPITSSSYHVETRTLPRGGVYGLHWTQWNHLIYDYYNYNYTPIFYRTLRSMGLLLFNSNPSSSSYISWNFWDQSLDRIANGEVGMTPYDFVKSILPFSNSTTYYNDLFVKYIFPHADPNLNKIDIDDDGIVMKEFLINTIHYWNHIQSIFHYIMIVLYCSGYTLYYYCNNKSSSSSSSSPSSDDDCSNNSDNTTTTSKRYHRYVVPNLILRFILYKGIVILLFSILMNTISNTNWSKNLQGQRLLNLPEFNHSSYQFYPSLPSTLPIKNDILISYHIQSKYLANNRNVINHIHPGNRLYYQSILPMYSNGYYKLSSNIQYEICQYILQYILNNGHRILIKNLYGNWAMADNIISYRFIHKDLMMKSNGIQKMIIEEIDDLWSETQYGYWRDTILHQKIISKSLLSLQDHIMNYNSSNMKGSKTVTTSIKDEEQVSHKRFHVSSPLSIQKMFYDDVITNRNQQQQIFSIPHHSSLSSMIRNGHHQNIIMNILKPIEPEPNVWLSVGDHIEAIPADASDDNDDSPPYWYSATIVFASASSYTYRIRYGDGTIEGLMKPYLVRRFQPYQINEMIEIDVTGQYEFKFGQIIQIDDETNNVTVEYIDEGELKQKIVSSSFLRRSLRKKDYPALTSQRKRNESEDIDKDNEDDNDVENDEDDNDEEN